MTSKPFRVPTLTIVQISDSVADHNPSWLWLCLWLEWRIAVGGPCDRYEENQYAQTDDAEGIQHMISDRAMH